MTTTSTNLIDETLRYLYAGARDPMNTLAAAISDTTGTSVMLTYDLGAAREGSVISIDLELMYVWAVTSEPAKTITVSRAMFGSTAATHASGATVTVNPKFSPFTVLEAINADLDDLSGNGLFKTTTVSQTYSPAVDGYDLTGATGILEILDVKYEETGPSQRWPAIRSWELKRESDTGDFASGIALVLNSAAQPGLPVRITYSAPFTHFTALGQDIATITGLPPTANDIPPLGAALRLQSVREGQRNFNESQPATRRAVEVPPGAQYGATRGLQELRRARIRIEARRLQKYWPRKQKMAS